jgi:hypothetical protein
MTASTSAGRRRALRTAVTIGAAGALLAGMAAAPASARPVESGSFENVDSYTFDDCGYPIEAEERLWGRYVIKDARRSTDGQFFYFQQQAWFEGAFRNPANGRTSTIEWNTTFKELQAEVIEEYDADDGHHLVIVWRTHEAGPFDVWKDSDGTVVYRATGNLVREYTGDFVVDDAPGGVEFIGEELVRAAGRWAEPDYCDLFDQLLG